MAKKKLIPVQFIQKYKNYTIGEIAGFSQEQAKALCGGDKPIASPYKPKAVEK